MYKHIRCHIIWNTSCKERASKEKISKQETDAKIKIEQERAKAAKEECKAQEISLRMKEEERKTKEAEAEKERLVQVGKLVDKLKGQINSTQELTALCSHTGLTKEKLNSKT